MDVQIRVTRLGDQEGFTVVEMMGALSILTIAFFALALSASTGLRLLTQAQQRQAASEIANERIEHLRNVPYADVAMDSDEIITRSTDPQHPDYWLNDAATAYDYRRDGIYETLIFATEGTVPHVVDPVEVGFTTLRVYQYATWIDDPDISGTQDYKRIVVVVSYHLPPTGRPGWVQAAAIFTPDGVVFEGDELGATVGSSTSPSASPSPSPSPSGSCSGDTSAPTGSFSILSGTGATTGYTNSENVTIKMSPSDACLPITVRFSNDNATYGSSITYDALHPTVSWTLTSGDGTKSVWARFRDGVGNTVTVGPKTIELDQTLPTKPGTLSRTVSCSGTERSVTLSWGTSSDVNLIGYRIYRSVNNEPYAVLATTSTTSGSDKHLKGLDSVRYYVVAYDKAGNESLPTNEISLSKNQCS